MNAVFEKYLNTTAPYLKQLAYKLTGDAVNAADLYQDTMLKLLSNETSFNLDTNFKSWSQTIMRNTFINYHRSKTRRKTNTVQNDDLCLTTNLTQIAQNDGEITLNYEFLSHIVEELGEKYRQAFQLYAEGYPYEEMAVLLEISVPLLRTRVFTAKRLLQSRLQELKFAA